MCSRPDDPTQHDDESCPGVDVFVAYCPVHGMHPDAPRPTHVHRPALGATLHDTALETGRTEDSIAFALATTAERCARCPARLVLVARATEDWRPITPDDVFMEPLEDKR